MAITLGLFQLKNTRHILVITVKLIPVISFEMKLISVLTVKLIPVISERDEAYFGPNREAYSGHFEKKQSLFRSFFFEAYFRNSQTYFGPKFQLGAYFGH